MKLRTLLSGLLVILAATSLGPLAIATTSPLPTSATPLLNGTVGSAYWELFTPPVPAPYGGWGVSAGSLPPGLNLYQEAGSDALSFGDAAISGIPTASGVYTFSLSVSGGGKDQTTTYSITVGNLALTSLQPSNASPGGAAFGLSVNGTGFVSNSIVQWNGSGRPTTFVSATQLTAAIGASDIASAGTAQVTVTNPGTSNMLTPANVVVPVPNPQSAISNALTFTVGSAPGGPVVNNGGIVNGASFALAPAPVAPGSIISIFGSNLASGILTASSTPLPTELGTTSAIINGIPLPLFYVSPSQINAQVPFETSPGTASLVVMADGISSPPANFTVAAASPGIFLYGATRAVAENADGSMNAANNSAKPGEVIGVYMTGQGAVVDPVPTGWPALLNPLSEALTTTTATIGGVNAPVSFSGLTPGFVGLLQVNVQVPNVAAGDQPLVVTIGGAASNSGLITVASQ